MREIKHRRSLKTVWGLPYHPHCMCLHV